MAALLNRGVCAVKRASANEHGRFMLDHAPRVTQHFHTFAGHWISCINTK